MSIYGPLVADIAPVQCRPRHEPTMLARRVTHHNVASVAAWAGCPYSPDTSHRPAVLLRTHPMDGAPGAPVIPAEPGDWVVRGVTGNHFRLSDPDFRSLYEVIQ